MAQSAPAADSKDQHWPCIQRKVPEITAGIVWSGPEIEEDDTAWRQDPVLDALVKRLAQRRLSIDEAQQEIGQFAASLQSSKTPTLTRLFTGLLQTIGRERRDIMSGIERYAKRQLALAERINTSRHELSALLKSDQLTDEQIKQRDALEEKLSWDTRIFDERQQSLTYVCESPVLLEQRLFALGRKILEHVE
jgi:hypothetical protein